MIKQRIIHAGDTPLFSDFTVTQTGPMQLTVSGGDFQITGQAKIVPHIPNRFVRALEQVPPGPTQGHVPILQEYFDDGRAEMMPDGKRARVWLQDKVTKKIKDKSKRRTVVGQTVINVVAHPSFVKVYQITLSSPSDTVMLVKEDHWFIGNDPLSGPGVPLPDPNLTHILVFPFEVSPGTTDLSGIDIEVFTVLPGFPSPTPEWEV